MSKYSVNQSLIMSTKTNSSFPSLWEMVFGDNTPTKAFLTALVVGTILTGINHGDSIINGDVPPLIKVGLTYCVPYFVTTWGVVVGKRAQWRQQHSEHKVT